MKVNFSFGDFKLDFIFRKTIKVNDILGYMILMIRVAQITKWTSTSQVAMNVRIEIGNFRSRILPMLVDSVFRRLTSCAAET